MRHPHGLRAASNWFLNPANIGTAIEGGYFAGLISHTADGNPTHALIVAPRATGASGSGYTLTTAYQWKTEQTSTTGTLSDFDGAANTASMTSSPSLRIAHPAATFCWDLNIGGYSDWYLPARFELDIAYYHLKPTTSGNNTSWGINDYSVPKRTANYTAGDPAQTSVTAFKATDSEPFVASSVNHWSSTQGGAGGNAHALGFTNGAQTQLNKNITGPRVRAFRRIAL